MQGKPIQGFENEYYITENGDIIDLETGKFKTFYVRGNEIKPRVDLYKDGFLELSVYVEDIMCNQFFGKMAKGYYMLKYKDGDPTNISLSNLDIESRDNYVPKISIKKPKKKFELTVNGPVVLNQDEIDEVKNINYIRSLNRTSGRRSGRNYIRKNPIKGSPEHTEKIKQQRIGQFIRDKVKQFEEMSIRDNVKCNITVNDIMEKIKSVDYKCEVTNIPLTFERKKPNTVKIVVMRSRDQDLTVEGLCVMASKLNF